MGFCVWSPLLFSEGVKRVGTEAHFNWRNMKQKTFEVRTLAKGYIHVIFHVHDLSWRDDVISSVLEELEGVKVRKIALNMRNVCRVDHIFSSLYAELFERAGGNVALLNSTKGIRAVLSEHLVEVPILTL